MEKRAVTLELPKQVWEALQKRDPSLEQAITSVLQSHVAHNLRIVDAKIDATFLQRLKGHFENARSWPELQGRLKLIGLTLRASPKGLALFETDTRQRVCGLQRLGCSESELVNQLGRPFPQVAQRWHRDSLIDRASEPARTGSGCKQSFAATAHRR